MSDGLDLEPRHASDGVACTAGPAGTSCQRCTGFVARHGAYASDVAFSPRAGEIAEAWRPLVPTYRPADEPMLRLLALVVARLETTAQAIDAAAEPMEAERLLRDERALVNRARNLLNDLGMSPTARARLGLDVALTRGSLARYLAGAYVEGDEGKDSDAG